MAVVVHVAACDIDFPRSCYNAAHILDEQLLINAPIELYELSLQIELYHTACLSNFQDSCERIEPDRLGGKYNAYFPQLPL